MVIVASPASESSFALRIGHQRRPESKIQIRRDERATGQFPAACSALTLSPASVDGPVYRAAPR
jgi:hypothetical protein